MTFNYGGYLKIEVKANTIKATKRVNVKATFKEETYKDVDWDPDTNSRYRH